MPTGYTAAVVDGKITEFPDFAMTCARAFGALITMRDDPMDAPIPDKFEEDGYYAKRVAEGLKELGDVQAMTDGEANQAAVQAYQNARKSRADYLQRQETEAERINAMLAKVRAWTPPTPDHQEMKKFMIDQLTISLPGDYAPAIPELLDGPTWRQRKIDELAKSVAYSKVEREKEIERAKSRTQWVKDLRASLAA
ncbi:MAG: hypothetical protein KGL39_20090 [Patescibacteria group bacterium]|nr:hypothetical protein [Patescibacteria group bacterium]